MKDKEYHVANFATFVSKTLTFSLQKSIDFNLNVWEDFTNYIKQDLAENKPW